jgi:FkbM family methyltransferase
MISGLARRLAGKGYPKGAEILLNGASLLSGRATRIKYNKAGMWTHFQKQWVVNEVFPHIRLDMEKEVRFMNNVYFHDFQPAADDIIVDVGAGIGLETIYMGKRLTHNGKIYAIEASPFTYEVLKANIYQNSLVNVEPFNLAISDKPGRLKIGSANDDHINNSVFKDSGVEVDAITMDEFMIQNQIEVVSLLKVNIEGAEKLLIRAFESISRVKHIAISCHDFLYKRSGDANFISKEEVSQFLQDNNFDIHSKKSGIDFEDDWIYGTNRNI